MTETDETRDQLLLGHALVRTGGGDPDLRQASIQGEGWGRPRREPLQNLARAGHHDPRVGLGFFDEAGDPGEVHAQLPQGRPGETGKVPRLVEPVEQGQQILPRQIVFLVSRGSRFSMPWELPFPAV